MKKNRNKITKKEKELLQKIQYLENEIEEVKFENNELKNTIFNSNTSIFINFLGHYFRTKDILQIICKDEWKNGVDYFHPSITLLVNEGERNAVYTFDMENETYLFIKEDLENDIPALSYVYNDFNSQALENASIVSETVTDDLGNTLTRKVYSTNNDLNFEETNNNDRETITK